MNMVYDRLTERAKDVLANLEAKRLRAYDHGLFDAARQCVFAASCVVEAVTADVPGETRVREIMARALVEAPE